VITQISNNVIPIWFSAYGRRTGTGPDKSWRRQTTSRRWQGLVGNSLASTLATFTQAWRGVRNVRDRPIPTPNQLRHETRSPHTIFYDLGLPSCVGSTCTRKGPFFARTEASTILPRSASPTAATSAFPAGTIEGKALSSHQSAKFLYGSPLSILKRHA